MTATATSQFTHTSNGFFFFPEPSTVAKELVALMDGNARQHGDFVVSVPFALVGGVRTEAMTFNVFLSNDFSGSTFGFRFADPKVEKALVCMDKGDFFFKVCDEVFKK